ncbi:hypothetical protein OH492_08355 [Vibrio chagasii]|nr:hypothetical protein [Vibrio chagasii]
MKSKAGKPIEVINFSVPYFLKIQPVFSIPCVKTKRTVCCWNLLEIESKTEPDNLLLIDSAVRIVCREHEVTFQALTENGQALIEHLTQNVKAEIKSDLTDNLLTPTLLSRATN